MVAILGLLALRCSVNAQPFNAVAAGAKPSCTSSAVASFSGISDTATQHVVVTVACATETLRGLNARTPVVIRLVDAATMSAMVKQIMQKDAAAQALANAVPALQVLGALTTQEALTSIVSSKYNLNAIAQYNLYGKTLYVQAVKGHLTPLDLGVISHEYERALQDQYFDLATLLSDNGKGYLRNSDARLAREAVVEGDAFTTMLRYAATFDQQQKLQFAQQLQRSAQPPTSSYLYDAEVGFSASQGTTFVTALRAAAATGHQGDAAKQAAANNAINQALRSPPVSTAEVLNPTRYLQRVDGHNALVAVPAVALGSGWSEADSDVMGAYGIDDLLQEHATDHSATAQAADQAAASWQDDRWIAYQHGSDTFLVWRLHFTSASGAASFVQALNGYTAARFHTTITAHSQLDWSTTGFAVSVRQHGTDVAVAMGSNKDLLNQCVQALKTLGFS